MILRTLTSCLLNLKTCNTLDPCIGFSKYQKIYSFLFHRPLSSTYKIIADSKSDLNFNTSKAKLVLGLNLETPEDSLPFYKLPIKKLIHIQKITKNDKESGFCDNRLYYIASRIKCPPSKVSVQLTKRTFVYSLSFEWLKNSLDVLLEMGVSGDRILRDLWVLKYHHETIRSRLQRVKDMGVDKLYPWMVRCSEEVLNRSIALSQETRNILGDTKTTKIYLANRLNTSLEVIEDMYNKTPALKTTRVTKVKSFLDFLISEGYKEDDIIHKCRVFAASQKTVEQRLAKLREFGMQDINLNVLCRSRKDFNKYFESLQAAAKKDESTENEA